MSERNDYDVVIVGARVAGSPLAMLLARQGLSVLVLDRRPIDHGVICSHFIHASGVARLKRWGLLSTVIDSGCPPVRRLHSDWGEVDLAGTPVPYEGVDYGLCPRRNRLDPILLQAAMEAGAEFLPGAGVTELVTEEDVVRGVKVRIGRKEPVPVRARLVVGADGKDSVVARFVDTSTYEEHEPLTTTYLSYFANLPMEELLIHWRPGRCVPAMPTHDGLTVVLGGWSRDGWRTYRSDPQRHYWETVSTQCSPDFAERIKDAEQVERVVGHHHTENYYRVSHGPGWALVGDAGYHKDPVTALGISDAFRDAENLAEAIRQWFAGERPEDEALADYERRRFESSHGLYKYTIQQAKHEPLAPLTKAVLKALQDNPREKARFFGVLAGSVDPREFSDPHNLMRIIESSRQSQSSSAPS